MRIAGEALGTIETFTAEITNQVTGKVSLSWSAVSRDVSFLHYIIKRENQPIGTTTTTAYEDYCRLWHVCYEVQPFMKRQFCSAGRNVLMVYTSYC